MLLIILFTLAFAGLAFSVVRRMQARRRAQFRDMAPDVLPAAEPEAELEAPPAAAPEAEAAVEEVEAEAAEITAAPEVPQVAVVAKREADVALKRGLAKTHASLMTRLNQLLGRGPTIDPKLLDELEEILLTADMGVTLSTRLLDELRAELKANRLQSMEELRAVLKQRILAALSPADLGAEQPLLESTARPKVILFVGVNGVGKTTTIGKIAAHLSAANQSVVLGAGDTFRAAAAEQLSIWADRSGARIIRGDEGSDPASVIFNAIEHAKQSGADYVLADTAGRLHTKTNLMDEIKKVKRVVGKAREGAPDETWLVVDGTTGQNALMQAREFHQALGLTGVILTKLDGTAKGGVVVAIVDSLKIPVRYVGVGETADDLRPFHAGDFVDALFAND